MGSFEIILRNMASLDSEQMSVVERRFAHITELARALAEKTADEPFYRDPAFASLYKTVAFRDMAEKYEHPDYSEKLLRDFGGRLNVIERAYLCGEINRLCGSSDPLFYFEKSEDILESDTDTVSYLRNYYADEAYNKFSEELESPQVMYNDDFVGVCEDVYDNRAKFCILPLENTFDGVLNSFRTIISKYELKTVMTCDVSTPDGEGLTKFALLKKNVEILPIGSGALYASFLLEVSDFDSELHEISIADILTAAECFGLKLTKLGSHVDSYDAGSVCEAVFMVGNGDLAGFLCFLQMEAPLFTVSGIYSHLPEF